MAKEIWKRVEINGESYSIKKFDAMTGIQIVRLLLANAAPLAALLKGEDAKTLNIADEATFGIMADVARSLRDEDLESLVKKCLRVCYANLPAGQQAVMDEHGYYGIEDIEYDFPLILQLCFEAIRWGAADFFGDNGLALTRQATSTLSLHKP